MPAHAKASRLSQPISSTCATCRCPLHPPGPDPRPDHKGPKPKPSVTIATYARDGGQDGHPNHSRSPSLENIEGSKGGASRRGCPCPSVQPQTNVAVHPPRMAGDHHPWSKRGATFSPLLCTNYPLNPPPPPRVPPASSVPANLYHLKPIRGGSPFHGGGPSKRTPALGRLMNRTHAINPWSRSLQEAVPLRVYRDAHPGHGPSAATSVRQRQWQLDPSPPQLPNGRFHLERLPGRKVARPSTGGQAARLPLNPPTPGASSKGCPYSSQPPIIQSCPLTSKQATR